MHIKSEHENIVYKIFTNLPTIQQLKIPNTIITGYSIYPTVEIINGTIVQSKFSWFKKKEGNDDAEWIKVGNGFTYPVTEEDIGCQLKVVCEPSDGKSIGLSKDVVSTRKITIGPKNCPFESRIALTQSLVPDDQIRIVSYNLLADFYANSAYSQENLYPYCKPQFLDFDYRFVMIYKYYFF